jgi:hypothetical protein
MSRNEIWLDIPGYEQLYQVSNCGRVRSLPRKIKTTRGFSNFKGKLLKPGIHSAGYLVVNLSVANKITQAYVHRLVALVFFGYSELEVNHKDLNTSNNHIGNLEYVTRKENGHHARVNHVKTGRTKLTKRDRDEIRIERAKGASVTKLAIKYRVLPPAIYELLNKQTWGWE